MTRTRLTAEQRHHQIVEAAVTAFSLGGYAGTTTDQVARLAGVSQPYVIRLFRTKQELFLAAVDYASGRIEARFREAADVEPTLKSLGEAYTELLAERELITLLLHGYTASADPSIGGPVRECFGRIYTTVRALTGAGAGGEPVLRPVRHQADPGRDVLHRLRHRGRLTRPPVPLPPLRRSSGPCRGPRSGPAARLGAGSCGAGCSPGS